MRARQARRLLGVLLLLAGAVLTGGCYDQIELKDRWLLVGVGVDQNPAGVRLTLQIPVERALGVAGGQAAVGGPSRAAILSAPGVDFDTALGLVSRRYSRDLMLSQTRVFAFSVDLARRGLGAYVSRLMRDPEVWPEAWIVLVDGEAGSLLRTFPMTDEVPLAYTWKLLDVHRRLGDLPDATLARFYTDLETPGIDPVAPVLTIRGDYPVVAGVGLFRHDRLVDVLDPVDAARLVRMMGSRRGGLLTLPCPAGTPREMTLRVWNSRSTVSVYPRADGSPGATLDIRMDTTLQSDPCRLPGDPEGRGLAAYVESQSAAAFQRLVRRLQRTPGTDPLGVGAWVRGRLPEAYARAPWPEQFERVPIDVQVSARVRHRGMFL